MHDSWGVQTLYLLYFVCGFSYFLFYFVVLSSCVMLCFVLPPFMHLRASMKSKSSCEIVPANAQSQAGNRTKEKLWWLTQGNRRDSLTKRERKTQAEMYRGKSKTWQMRREPQNQTGYNPTKNSNHEFYLVINTVLLVWLGLGTENTWLG